jgi:hypothetical protein
MLVVRIVFDYFAAVQQCLFDLYYSYATQYALVNGVFGELIPPPADLVANGIQRDHV